MTKLPTTRGATPSVPSAFNGEIYQAVGKYARSAVLFAFEDMGGPEALSEWAQANKDDFYTKLFPKIIARESEVTHHKTVDQLMDVIDGEFEVEGEFDEAEELPVMAAKANPDYAPLQYSPPIEEDLDEMLSGVDLVEFEE